MIRPAKSSATARAVFLLGGALLSGLGLWQLARGTGPLGLVAGLVLAVLGADLLIAAAAARRPLLARSGSRRTGT